jgi:hypothetical protein
MLPGKARREFAQLRAERQLRQMRLLKGKVSAFGRTPRVCARKAPRSATLACSACWLRWSGGGLTHAARNHLPMPARPYLVGIVWKYATSLSQGLCGPAPLKQVPPRFSGALAGYDQQISSYCSYSRTVREALHHAVIAAVTWRRPAERECPESTLSCRSTDGTERACPSSSFGLPENWGFFWISAMLR